MKFSVIIPVWNAEKTIESCLDSIFSQTSVPDEIIVIDGGSHDATLSIVEKYLRPEDYVYTEPDNGPYDAMNKGVAKAQGEIVAILNADDYWMPETCESVREAFAHCSHNTGIVHGDLKYIEEDGASKIIRPVPSVLNYFCIGMPTAHPATFILKEVYNDVGCYDFERYPMCADRDFVYRALNHGYKLKYVDRVLSCMRAGGLSSRTEYTHEIWQIIDRLPQPRKLMVKALRRLLGAQELQYTDSYDDAWPKEIAQAIVTLGGAPKKVLASITMRLALRTRVRRLMEAMTSKMK